jgi:hypothetical protein
MHRKYLLIVLLLAAWITPLRVNAAISTDPSQTGAIFYEFECGGDGANDDPGSNALEKSHQWWTANSLGGGGTPYALAGSDAYRAANLDIAQTWTYEFDLPDGTTNAVLRLEAHQAMKISITGPANVSASDRPKFDNGTVIYQGSGLNHSLVTVDLSPYLAAANVADPSSKIYLKFEGYDDGNAATDNNALLFHLRLDNGWPSFRIGYGYTQYQDQQYIVATNGSGVAAEAGNPSNALYRYSDQSNYVVYELDLMDSVSQAFLTVYGFQQYKWSLSTRSDDGFTTFAQDLQASTGNLGARVVNLAAWLANNPEKKVYVKMEDSEPGTGWGGGWNSVLVTPTDPRVGDAEASQGHVYYEFEMGGTGAYGLNASSQPIASANLPEMTASWFLVNAEANGGPPYDSATGANCFRAAAAGQFWIYEFDLPDTATSAYLRMELHQGTEVSITGPQNVSKTDHTVFNNGTVIFSQSSLNHTAVHIDLSPYLAAANVANAGKKFYLKFNKTATNSALGFHLRVDDGNPSFTVGGGSSQNDDYQYIASSPGSAVNWLNTENPWYPVVRYTDMSNYVIYRLDVPAGWTQSWVSVYGMGQYQYALSSSTSGPWDDFASSAITANASYNIKSEVADLAPYLAVSNTVYLLIKDSVEANGNGAAFKRVFVSPTDPRKDAAGKTFGTAYLEFEAGGTGANGTAQGPTNRPTTNMPESYQTWWILNSLCGGGTPYTVAGWNGYRVADSSQQWTYRFDLDNATTTAILRMNVKGNLVALAGSPAAIDANDPSVFNNANATTVALVVNSDLTAQGYQTVTADLSSVLTGNPTKEVYLRLQKPANSPVEAHGALVWHVRVDNGWPAFPCVGNDQRFNDEVFIADSNGSYADADLRTVSNQQYVTYELNLPDSVTSAVLTADVAGQFEMLVGKGLSGPFTRVASSEISGTARQTIVRGISSYLAGNATRTIYVKFADTQPYNGNSSPELISEGKAAVMYSVKAAPGTAAEVSLPPLIPASGANAAWTLY